MRVVIRFSSFLFGLAFSFCISSLSHASLGTDWLAGQQQADGGVYQSADLASPTQSSLESLITRQFLGEPATLDIDAVISFLATAPAVDTEHLSAKVIAGMLREGDSTIASLLIARQNGDGGFGSLPGYQSTPYDSYWALRALEIAGQLDGNVRFAAIQYLLNTQRPNGAWGYITSDSPYLTGRIQNLLVGYRGSIGSVAPSIASASVYLHSTEILAVPLSGDYFTACTALSSLSAANSTDDLAILADAVLAAQSADGSWQQDVFSTAICLRALLQYEAGEQGGTLASLSGQVVLSGTTQPISGVMVSMPDSPGLGSLTDAEGRFNLTGLGAGPLNLEFSASGYVSSVRTIPLLTGPNSIGQVALARETGTTIVRGVIVNASTGQALSSAAIELSGPGSYQASSDNAGQFSMTNVAAGSYSLTVTASGYHSVATVLDVAAGGGFDLRLQLAATATVLDNSPAPLGGRVIDGVSHLPLGGATLNLVGVGQQTASANGLFTFDDVERGDHVLGVSAVGYAAANVTFNFPAGSSGALGDLALYPLSDIEAATQIDLSVTVRDAVTGETIAGAAVLHGGTSTTTDAAGSAFLSGITTTSFTVQVSAIGYLSQQASISVSGFGAFSLPFSLTPASDEPLDTLRLTGVITDSNGSPIDGVVIDIDGAGLGVTTDMSGAYSVDALDTLAFTVNVNKPGYKPVTRDISVDQFGHYVLNFTLEPASNVGWQLYYLNSEETIVEADSEALFTASIQNLGSESASVIVRGQVFDTEGTWVGELSPLTAQPPLTDPVVSFAPGEVKQLVLPFYTRQLPAGRYVVSVDVVEVGSISQDLPNGLVYTSGNTTFTINPSQSLTGDLAFNPPLAQAGADTAISLNVLLVNSGNISLPPGEYQLTLSTESGEELLRRTLAEDELPSGNVMTLDFGDWVADTAGHLVVKVSSIAAPTAGEVMGLYYVGDLASGELRLDQTIFPEGDNQTTGHLEVRGVDTTQVASTDPLFERAIEAVRAGGEFVGAEATAWHKRNRCLGCHTQTQSLVGMASSLPYTTIDEDQTTFLFNVIASSQQNRGQLRISHNNFIRTQQQLATWALVEWPDKAGAHRTKLRGLQYLWSLRTTSGNSIYWSRDHQTGWLTPCCEGSTAIAARAIVDLIQSEKALQDEALLDYQIGSNIGLDRSRLNPRGVHQEGDLLTIAKRGMIERVDLSQGTSEVLYVDANNRQFLDVAVGGDGTLYATTASHLVKISSDGSVEELYLTPRALHDVVLWNGDLYVADRDDDRIWRVTTSLDAIAFAEGGLLSGPMGLTVASDGAKLLATNWDAFNVVAIDPLGQVINFADGLAFRPGQIAPAHDSDSYYVSTQTHSESGAQSPAALHLIRSDKSIINLVGRTASSLSLYGLAITDDGIVFSDYSRNVLGTVEITELDRSFVDTLQGSLPSIANYFLAAHQRSDNEIVRVAFRLMGLAEIEKVVTDPALLTQIAQAKTSIADQLRSRQLADGGWQRLPGYGSDPLTTAWVGYALDYTEPSAEDPVVRNAITYLLNTQSGNGSWSGRFFNTRLSATSLVMLYLPRALGRLGGLDVAVELTFPTDVDLTGATITPDHTEPNSDGSVLYRWDLVGVTGSGRLIDLNLDIFDLLLGENRPVAQMAKLSFANSFTGEVLSRDIAIPTVSSTSGLGLGTSTDKSQYLANEAVLISSLINNAGLDFSDGSLRLSIRTAAGGFVSSVFSGESINILAGGQQGVDSEWNTAQHPAGPYQVFAQLLSDAGLVQAEAVASFTILPSDGQVEVLNPDRYDTSIATDQTIYTPYSNVQLDSQVINEVLNVTQAPVLALIQVRGPGGIAVFDRSIVVQEMAPGAVNSYMDLVTLVDAPPGLYYATLTLWDAAVSEQLAAAETLFSVIERPLAHLSGTVTVDKPVVYRGQAVTCSEEVNNLSHSVTVDAELMYRVVNVDTQQEQAFASEALQFTPSFRYLTSHTYNTLNLAPGNYACVLLARVGNDETTLDFASFTVELPPVEFATGVGSQGRLLIMLDGAGGGGTGDISGLSSQDAYLRELLDANGYSYTIVYSGDDFATEFHSGLYHSYALMSEKVQLAVDVENQLAEAVNAGAGLYIAGAFNRRNNHVERALGIHSTGRNQKADGVIIPEGALGPEWPETLIQPNTMLEFERCGAVAIGIYVNPKKGTGPDDPQCYNVTNINAAVAGYQYGRGKAVYVGFDALDEAAHAGGDNAYANLMLYGLRYIQPSTFEVRAGSVLPLSIHISSQEVPVSAQVLIDLPENLQAIDQIPGMVQVDPVQGVWRWVVNLQEFSETSAIFYVRLLDDDDVDVTVSVGVEIEGELIEIGSSNLIIPTDTPRNYLAEGVQALQALVMNYPDEGDFPNALTSAQKAQNAAQEGDAADAVSHLLAAVESLSGTEIFDAHQARYVLDIAMFNLLAGVAP